MCVYMNVYVYLSALRWAGDLSRVCPAFHSMTAGIGSSFPPRPGKISGLDDLLPFFQLQITSRKLCQHLFYVMRLGCGCIGEKTSQRSLVAGLQCLKGVTEDFLDFVWTQVFTQSDGLCDFLSSLGIGRWLCQPKCVQCLV